jgi:hypothetical protein
MPVPKIVKNGQRALLELTLLAEKDFIIVYYISVIGVVSLMKDATTIQLKKSVVQELKSIRRYPRETYNEIICELIRIAKGSKKNLQYDEFIHRIQQAKMKELWGNGEDEAWEDA